MKIGIVTQPLKANYGGILQNWALQQTLIKMGHEPVTIDYLYTKPFFLWVKVNIYNLLQLLKLATKHFDYFKRRDYRPLVFEDFVLQDIKKTSIVRKYSKNIAKKGEFDVIIVGSDQVWRPMFNKGTLFDMFLQFVPSEIRKISYAASFGVDTWEYTDSETRKCKQLIQGFDAVSVREASGVTLSKNHFGIEAVQVLDPTMLLEKNDYLDMIADVYPLCKTPFLAAYILDPTDEQREYIQKKANELGLTPKLYHANEESVLSPKQWISLFRDAEYIITDSFHGSVFSLIFGKPFETLGNSCRGDARFDLIRDIKEKNNLPTIRKESYEWLQNSILSKNEKKQ